MNYTFITLTCYGNYAIHGGTCPNLLESHKSFQFQDYVNFSIPRKRLFDKHGRAYVADNPNDWLEHLLDNGIKGLTLDYSDSNQPDEARKTAGFVGGGGSWVILAAHGDNRFDAWEPHTLLGYQDAPDHRIWQTTYHKISENFMMTPVIHSIGHSSQRLLAVLEDALKFAAMNKMTWAEHFQNAIVTIETQVPKHMYDTDLCPPDLADPQALALLDACMSASVFGGMGSWNDPWITDGTHEEYEVISRELWASLTQGILASANSTCPMLS